MLYELHPIIDDARFQGFVFRDKASVVGNRSILFDHLPSDAKTKGLQWTPPSLASVWKPREVIGDVSVENDFPCVNNWPAFSSRAVDVLGDLLRDNGELLPLQASTGEFYAFNTRTKADVLDKKRSQVDWVDNDQGHRFAQHIERFETSLSAIGSLGIFRIPEKIATVFVTQTFVDCVAVHRLAGFEFRCVWPWGKVGNYKAIGNESLDALLRDSGRFTQTLVLRLGIEDSESPSDPHEWIRGKIEALEELLRTAEQEAQVATESEWLFADAEYQDREARIYFSCTDVRGLFELIRPKMRDAVASPTPVECVLRFGGLFDTDCPEEFVTVR
ncbi:hypothetical protein Mal4_39210 [Maioricimonas rarisocia]|uniref:Uncharacterized protein n=1 Tax=Maioricimonas rarisocia TaxID=2528026 RepID=A0A517ZAP6_9PLAN|nr:hypothetical protein [Maioricimonas rarisocia]QDU39576.1 hypothetical protein Mal4_39210 [Maioricimonas rarisocia]